MYSALIGAVGLIFGLFILAVSLLPLFSSGEVIYKTAVIGLIDVVISAWLVWKARDVSLA